MKKYVFLYNPASGRSAFNKKIEQLQKNVDKLPGSRFITLDNQDSIAELVRNLMPAFDVIVACGGDGTIREIARPLVHTNKSIGIIPMGSGNDLIKTLKIPADIDEAFQVLTNHEAIPIDVGTCNDFIFLNTLGFGFDAMASRYAANYGSAGKLRYIFASLKANIRRSNFAVTIRDNNRDEYREVIMITFANGKVEGGTFWLAPDASVTDGILNMITIDPISPWLLPICLPFTFFKKATLIPKFKTDEVNTIQLNLESPVNIHADGEIIASKRMDFKVGVLPRALNIICPS